MTPYYPGGSRRQEGGCHRPEVVRPQCDDPLIGEFSDERCPECGCNLLKNAAGEVWCSFVECDYARLPDGTVYSMREVLG
jgi:hypothetical protein